jgi:hypothetical protein
MKTKAFKPILLLLMGFLAQSICADDLWNMAVKISQQNQQWLAQVIQVQTLQLDDKGEVTGQGEMLIRRTIDSLGTIKMETESSGDGSPDPESFLQTGVGTPLTLRPFQAPRSIFSPESQPGLERQRVGAGTLEGQEAIIYRFEHREQGRVKVWGNVWLDQITGIPLKMVTRQEDDAKGMLNRETTVIYNADPQAWYPLSILTTGTVRRMIFERDIRIVAKLQEHILYSDGK